MHISHHGQPDQPPPVYNHKSNTFTSSARVSQKSDKCPVQSSIRATALRTSQHTPPQPMFPSLPKPPKGTPQYFAAKGQKIAFRIFQWEIGLISQRLLSKC
eukprot:scaffold3774_cov126-Cylindrotheca_fusiformis.AAC.6